MQANTTFVDNKISEVDNRRIKWEDLSDSESDTDSPISSQNRYHQKKCFEWFDQFIALLKEQFPEKIIQDHCSTVSSPREIVIIGGSDVSINRNSCDSSESYDGDFDDKKPKLYTDLEFNLMKYRDATMDSDNDDSSDDVDLLYYEETALPTSNCKIAASLEDQRKHFDELIKKLQQPQSNVSSSLHRETKLSYLECSNKNSKDLGPFITATCLFNHDGVCKKGQECKFYHCKCNN